MERKYMMYEGDDTNSIDLLLEKETTERNGVKVIVPLKYRDEHNFYNKIKEQLAYFEDVYFDVESISPNYNYRTYGQNFSALKNDHVIYRGELIQYSELYTGNEMHICLDNVYYPIDWGKIGISRINIPIALRFSLNEGLFPIPNREQLKYSVDTIEAIKNKIRAVSTLFVTKYNEKVKATDMGIDIKAIYNFFNNSSIEISKFYANKNEECIDITCLIEHSDVEVEKPTFSNIKYLNMEYLLKKSKDLFFREYRIKFDFSRGKFSNADNWYNSEFNISRFYNRNDYNNYKAVYIYSDVLSKPKKDYLRTIVPSNSVFVKRTPRKLGIHDENYSTSYYSYLQLDKFPKSQWRNVIKEYQHLLELATASFINLDEMEIPQTWIDEQKAKRMAVLKVGKTVATGKKKVDRLQGEFNGKTAESLERYVSGQNAKFTPTVYKLESLHIQKGMFIYGKEEDREKLDGLYGLFKTKKVKFVIVANKTYDILNQVKIHNWKNVTSFMEDKNKVFRKAATSFYIGELRNTYRNVFEKCHSLSYVSKELSEKIGKLVIYAHNNVERYYDINTNAQLILDYAKQNNVFDESIIHLVKEVEMVLSKLPFLDRILQITYSIRGNESIDCQIIADLFKYHRQKVNLDLYKMPKLTEEENKEELTEELLEEIQ